MREPVPKHTPPAPVRDGARGLSQCDSAATAVPVAGFSVAAIEGIKARKAFAGLVREPLLRGHGTGVPDTKRQEGKRQKDCFEI